MGGGGGHRKKLFHGGSKDIVWNYTFSESMYTSHRNNLQGIKYLRLCFTILPNTEERVENMRCSGVFLMNFKVFEV